MKKRNRVLAGVLAVLLVLTSFTWPSSNTMVASADDSSSGAAAQSTPYKKIKYNFGNVDVTTLTDFTSTQLNSQTGVVEGSANQPAQNHWFSGETNPDSSKTNAGLKPRTHRDDNRNNLLSYKDAYTNFAFSTKVNWNTNIGFMLGEKNVYAAADSTTSVMIWCNQNGLSIRGAIDTSTAKVEGTIKSLTGSGQTRKMQVASSNLDGTTQTIHVRMLDGVLTVWVEGYNEVLTVNVKNTYASKTNVALWAMGYSNKIGFQSFEFANLDEYGYTDFEYANVAGLTDFTSTQLDSSNNTIVGNAEQAVSSHWFTGLVNPDNSKTNSGLKPKTIRNDNRNNLLNYKGSYENFEFAAEVCWNTNIGFMLGQKNVYAAADSTTTVMIWCNQNGLSIRGAIDTSTAKVEGTIKSLTGSGQTRKMQVASSNLDGTTQTVQVRMLDGVLTVWVEGYNEVLTVNVKDTYASKTNVALWAMGYNNKIGFKTFGFTDLDAKEYAFDNADVTALTDFTSTQLDSSNGNAPVGDVNQTVASHWFTGLVNPDNSKTNSGLKPKTIRNDNKNNLLAYNDAYGNFELKTEVCWNTNVGFMLGEKNVYAKADSQTSIMLWCTGNGLTIHGAIDTSTAEVAGTIKSLTGSGQQRKIQIASSSLDGTTQTISVKLLDGVLNVWVEGYNEVLTVNVKNTYSAETNISFWAMGYNNKIGFKSMAVKELEGELNTEPAVQAQVGEGFSEQFLPSDTNFKVSDLNDDFSAYYFASNTAESMRVKASNGWADSNWGIRPTHNRASGAHTLLTYDRLIFKNVEITSKYQRNWGQYAIMIAPVGELATVENNGIKVWVESEGRIRVTGAIDAGSASSTGGYVTVLGQNMVAGYDIGDYANKATDKFYNLHAKIEGKVLYVWMDEIPEYVISVNVTDDYQGGLVSLYSNGSNDGGFGSFTAVEIEDPNFISNAYIQSFNTIDSLEELTDDFKVYTLDSVKNKPEKVENSKIGEVFKLENGRLMSNASEGGSNDRTNYSILTLAKEYKNFELTFKYEQHISYRYGVMFGTADGEFAYTQKGDRLKGNEGALVYTEAEGYRNVRGALYTSSYTDASEVLHRDKGEEKLDSFWWYNNDVMNNVQRKTVHTMTIRVVGEYMTMLLDNNENSRVTVRLNDYDGGYVSLVTNAKAVADETAPEYGAFLYLAVTELDEDAQLGADPTQTPEGFGYETLADVEKDFDAYYLADATVTSNMEKVNLEDRWWLDDGGILKRTTVYDTSVPWRYAESKDVDVLTYTKQKYTDFELTYTYQQTARRLGIVIGGDLGVYPITCVNDKFAAEKGAIVFLEAQGYSNVKGHLNNTTNKDTILYRNTLTAPEQFRDASGSTTSKEGTLHTVKVVVKDKQLYMFIDGSTQPSLYVHLGDNYSGGYVSLFAHANNWHGFKNFTITDKVTTKLPAGKGTSSSGNTFTADFDCARFDDSAFTTYYLDKTKGNETGAMEKQNFEDQWTIDNGVLQSNNKLTNPTSKNLEKFEYDDSTKVSVLTYNKKMTDFVVSFDYQKTYRRLMFMFGTEMGKFALNAPNTTQYGQGVLIYPENDLGVSGGICALGSLDTYWSADRPMARTKVTLDGYHIKDKWESNLHDWHTMTVAVINNHCYIYLDDYGLIADHELRDYEGGYISLASTARIPWGDNYKTPGFDNLKITDLSSVSDDAVISVETPKDISVAVGTDASALGLPTTVKATLKNGTKVDAPVTWKALNYNAGEEGVYQFTAVVGGNNPANVGVRQYVKVYKQVPATRSGVKEWRFDTPQDLKDFKATYLKNAETGYITADIPNWYVSQSGILSRDPFRSVNGDQYKELAILTYKGEKYTNFELEVEYTQQWQRMMVMFGSEKVGAYIDLKDIYAETNPVAGFVEMEGTRSFIGNLINANFDSNDKEKINNARESGIRLENYYDKVLYGGNQGKKHTMKIRVVGDQASMWVDNCETPYTCTITNYDGGYISLVSTVKGGTFDNLKITRLGPTPEEVIEENAIAANGTMNVSIDTNASTDLKLPKKVKPDSYEDFAGAQETSGIPAAAYVLGGSTILLSTLIGAIILLLARKKNKNQEEIKG